MVHVHGKVTVVTGASSGLGRAIARQFAVAGASLVLGARNMDLLDDLASEIRSGGGNALPVRCDVRREEDVVELFRQGLDRFGGIDVLINNAGIADHTPTDQLSTERWFEVIDTNLNGAFFCAREAMRIMKRQGRGRMIHIGSLSAITPRSDTIAYAASKFALVGMNHSLSLDGRDHGIASSIFHPGLIGTGLGSNAGLRSSGEDRVIGADVAARTVLAMADLPDHVNFLEGTMLPLSMPFLGRG